MAKTEKPETMENQEAAVYDPWKDFRQVYVPKRSRTEQNTLEVGVNNRTYFVPKETFTEVPAPVWEVIQEMLHRQKVMEAEAEAASGDREFALSH